MLLKLNFGFRLSRYFGNPQKLQPDTVDTGRNARCSIFHVNGTEIPSIDEIVERRFSEYNYLRSIDDAGIHHRYHCLLQGGCGNYATSVSGLQCFSMMIV